MAICHQSVHLPNAHRASSAGPGVPEVQAETSTHEQGQLSQRSMRGRQRGGPASALRPQKPAGPGEPGSAAPPRGPHSEWLTGTRPATSEGARSPRRCPLVSSEQRFHFSRCSLQKHPQRGQGLCAEMLSTEAPVKLQKPPRALQRHVRAHPPEKFHAATDNHIFEEPE